jgi:hypothetical protein
VRAHHATELIMKRVAAFLVSIACSSPSPSPGTGGPTATNQGCAAKDTNPYGACYPTGVGVIGNYCSGSFCFAQLYDPEGKLSARLLHLTVVAIWLGATLPEIDFITGANVTGQNPSGISWAKDLAPKVAFVEFVEGGVTLSPATEKDLSTWNQAQGSPGGAFLLDPGIENIGVYFDGAAIPFEVDVDLRTMKILDTQLGFDANLEQSLQSLLASLK